MPKLTLQDVNNILGNPTSAQNTINSNSDLIERALENTLSRNGESPNQLNVDLDLNNNDLLNVKKVHADELYLEGSRVTVISLIDVSDFATAAQGDKADTALQPSTGLYRVSTLGAAALSPIPSSVDRVEVQTHTASSPAGKKTQARYKRVSSEPIHSLKFFNAGWWEIDEPQLYPGMAGCVEDDGSTDMSGPLSVLLTAGMLRDVDVMIDGVYRTKSQQVFNLPIKIRAATNSAKIVSQIGSNSASLLVLGSKFHLERRVQIHRDFLKTDGSPVDPGTVPGTIITVGRTAYSTAPTAPQTDIRIMGKLTRNAGDKGNNISVSGWVKGIRIGADITGVHVEPGDTPEAIGVVFHWGAHGSLTNITTYSYHPEDINVDGLTIRGAGKGLVISSSSNVRGHVTMQDCQMALQLVPGDNAADAAVPSQKPSVGSNINISIHSTDTGPNAVYATSMGRMIPPEPAVSTLHALRYRNLNISGYVHLKTPAAVLTQVVDLEHLIASPGSKFSLKLENTGSGTGFDLLRVADVDLSDCSCDSLVAPVLINRSRNVRVLAPNFRKPRDTTTGTIPWTFGVRILGQRNSGALASAMSVGATSITLAAAFGQRCIPGDAIEITTTSGIRTVYASNFTFSTDTVIPIEPAGFAAASADVVVQRLDVCNSQISGGTIRGYKNGITTNLNDSGSDVGSTFEVEGLDVLDVRFREIADRDMHFLRMSQGNIMRNKQLDGGVGRILNASLTTRMMHFDACDNVNVQCNFGNADECVDVSYFLVANAATRRLHVTDNRLGPCQTAAFSAGSNVANSLYRDNYFLSGSAATT